MTTQLRRDFGRFLECGGYCVPPGRAACALSSARTLELWREYERAGLVRLRCEPDDTHPFDVYGEPEGYTNQYGRRVSAEEERKEQLASFERLGVWTVFSEMLVDGERDKWEMADSIGGCAGYQNPLDPFSNLYVIDLMNAALACVEQSGEH